MSRLQYMGQFANCPVFFLGTIVDATGKKGGLGKLKNRRKPAPDKAFRAVLARAREKNKKKQEKNGGENPRLVGKPPASSTHRPPPCGWGKGGYAAEQPYMPKLGPLSLSRLLLRWASLACSCCHSATLGESMTAFTVRAT